MSQVTCNISISLDGYAAGPNDSPENPLGEGGERLHEWAVATESFQREHGREGGESSVDSQVLDDARAGLGAVIMGRGMFGGGGGPWDDSWKGWWGDKPPFGGPVFVLTHHPREPLELTGTTFRFVTGGIEAALERAREAAGGKNVAIAGGPSTINQYLAAGLLDELTLHIVPFVMGGGKRLLVDVGDPQLEPVKVVASPAVTHVTYRLG